VIAAGKVIINVRSFSDIHRIYALGDIHWGNFGCSLDTLHRDIATIKADPLAKVILMGDLADYISPADKRWDPSCVTPRAKISDMGDWGKYLARGVVAELTPIKDKIIGGLSGNHEHTFECRQAQQLHAWTCAELGIPDWGYCCFLDLSFRYVGSKGGYKVKRSVHRNGNENYGISRTYRFFCHHGAGAAQTPGGKTNRLVAFMNSNEADIFLIGHVHEKDVKRLDILSADNLCRVITSRKKLGVFTGTYLKTYQEGARPGYGERAGYRPVPLGCSVLEIQPFHFHVLSDGRVSLLREDSVSARVSV
jgi:hypothetical protein